MGIAAHPKCHRLGDSPIWRGLASHCLRAVVSPYLVVAGRSAVLHTSKQRSRSCCQLYATGAAIRKKIHEPDFLRKTEETTDQLLLRVRPPDPSATDCEALSILTFHFSLSRLRPLVGDGAAALTTGSAGT